MKLKYVGMGTGKGEEYEALARKEIERIIEGNLREIYTAGWKAQIPGYKNGFGCVSLKTGKVFGMSLGTGEAVQAVDNAHIAVFRIDQNRESMQERDEDGVLETIEDSVGYICTQDIRADMLYIQDDLDRLYGGGEA